MKVKLHYRIMLIISAFVHFLEVQWKVKPNNSFLCFLKRHSFVDGLMSDIGMLSNIIDIYVDDWFNLGDLKPDYEAAYTEFHLNIWMRWESIVNKFMILWDGLDAEKLYFLCCLSQDGLSLIINDSYFGEDLRKIGDEIHEAYHQMGDTKEIPWTLGDVYIINAEIKNWDLYLCNKQFA